MADTQQLLCQTDMASGAQSGQQEQGWGGRERLVHVVEPVDQVEERERDGEDDARPLVDGVDVCQVGNLHLELWGPTTQAALLGPEWPLQRRRGPTVQVAARQRLAVLDAGAVVREHGVGAAQAAQHLHTGHLVPQVHVGQVDVPVSVDL